MSDDLNDGVNSYFNSVWQRTISQFPTRQFLGPVDSMDWPPETVHPEAFYLISLGDNPSSSHEMESRSQPFYTATLQWSWLIIGTELTAGVRGQNRGDRGSINGQMKKELLFGNFPYFCQKQHFSMDQATGIISSALLDPEELIRWTRPTFLKGPTDKASGVLFGVATVYVTDCPVTITS